MVTMSRLPDFSTRPPPDLIHHEAHDPNPIRRHDSPAEQMMEAWTVASSHGAAPDSKIKQRATEACPPEVYLG